MNFTMPTVQLSQVEARAEETARLLRALGNRHRLLILCRLLQVGEASAGALAQHLGLSDSSLSQHLKRMRDEGLVASRRQVRTLWYRVGDMGDNRLPTLLKSICAPAARTPASEANKPTTHTYAALAMALGEASPAASAQSWQMPAITTAGPIQAMPQAAYQPDPDAECRLVFTLSAGTLSPAEIHPGLARVARTVNLYIGAGLTREQLHFVAMASGDAIEIALADDRYRELHGVDNPNLAVIRELQRFDVDIAVCGQSVAAHGYDNVELAPEVTIALSSLTAVAQLQRQGHALMPL